jgi:hypothetical protein
MPVVKLWADILALFEGKGRSGSSSFWSLVCNAVKSVNPKIKGHPGDFAIDRNDLDNAWQSLRPPSSRIPRTCTVLQANLFIANSTRHAYPDTQAEISVTNDPEHVVRTLPKKAKLQ